MFGCLKFDIESQNTFLKIFSNNFCHFFGKFNSVKLLKYMYYYTTIAIMVLLESTFYAFLNEI